MYKIMTPGPTQVRENVRLARSLEITNPDIDIRFCEEYKKLCDDIGEILHTKNPVYILSGEGILGLEAACASLTEAGDKVLVIDNGVYGAGFADFVSMYGGKPVLYTKPYNETIDIDELKKFLLNNHDFKYATLVHHDTPTGMINDVHKIGRLLNEYGILSVVDSVSGMIGEYLNVDEGKLDIVCGASQKAVSAPPGLTFVSVSKRALKAMESRKTPIASFYANLLIFKDYYEKKWFPYTMPASDIYGLRAAIENIKEDPGIIERHAVIGKALRETLTENGIRLYGENGYSNAATAFFPPDGLDTNEIISIMKDKYSILIAGSLGPFAGKLLRIGHMGENAHIEHVSDTLAALGETLSELGCPPEKKMDELFRKKL